MCKLSSICMYILFILHASLLFLTAVILLTCDNIKHICILGFSVFLILITNFIYEDCPISLIEEEYHGKAMMDYFNSYCPIKYNRKRRPEVTLQWIWTGLLLLMVKLLLLLSKISVNKYINLSNDK